ncbi:hypothetical protein [Gimesia fumaroli]|uniref:Carboxypeptidase regulatory-like domain-containing protein n=1 Tax=Gimesia fumaroli TaxID=2527976 RepID=A0A518IJ41_9PLAN|nr:hypothetical protein [Gimesia fumaroli]QDV53119.1 hypothetical protein Enr17x_51900 [Gimesia fumaroli]
MRQFRNRDFRSKFCVFVILTGLSLQSGCSSSNELLGTVSGTVTLDSVPISEGMLSFISNTGFAAIAEIKDGAYSITSSQYGDGIPAGEYQISVFSNTAKSDPLADSQEKTAGILKIPLKYVDPATSELSAKVNQGTNQFNFELSSP